MKTYFKRYSLITGAAVLLCILFMTSCKKGLDYSNTNAINPGNVWNDPNMIKAFLSDIYGGSLTGWSFDGNSSDEGISTPKSLGNYQRGIISVAGNPVNLNYTNIDKCNYLLDQLAIAPSSVLSTNLNRQYTGETKFWRAWAYWNMVSTLGGVPLILHTQSITDTLSLKVPRNKTSECIAQIVKDLDSAAMLLPANFTGTDFGRINKIAALGLKGRILLWYASPLFNPSNDQARWQTAYTATKAAIDTAATNGYGLLPNFRNIWYSPNKEMVMVHQYYFPDHYMNFAGIRAETFSNGASNNNQPIWSLLTAFPKKDGSPLASDVSRFSDPAYNAQFLTDFYTNRDDRFYATVACGGTPYPTPDIIAGQAAKTSYWNAWSSYSATSKVNILTMVTPGAQGNPGVTGFFDRKGLDTLPTGAQVVAGIAGAKSYWVPMRFGELLMNFGECANELGKSSEALNVLYQIRARASITPGAGSSYGISATSTADIRTAYIKERQVELAFENFRFPDLRRWKRFDLLNSQGARHGLIILLKAGQSYPSPTDNIITDPAVRAKFSALYFDNLDGDASFFYNLDLNHWFYPLNPSQIVLEPNNLPQNKEWGGSFDPLL